MKDPADINRWFSDLDSKYKRLGMQKEDVYNVDEIRFRIGIGKPEYIVMKALPAVKVAGQWRRCHPRKQISSSKYTTWEMASIIQYVSANGGLIPLIAILQS